MPRSNWAREPQLLSLRVWSLCSATGEAAIVRGPRAAMKSGPHLPQLEKALAQKRRPNTAKKKKGDVEKGGGVFFTKECQQISVRFKNCHLVTLSELTESCKNHQWILKLLSDNSQVSPQISEQS